MFNPQAVDGNKTAALTVEESKVTPVNSTADTEKKPANGDEVAANSTTTAPANGVSEGVTSPATTAPPSVAAEKGNSSTASAGDDEVTVLTFLGVVNGKKVISPTGKTHFRYALKKNCLTNLFIPVFNILDNDTVYSTLNSQNKIFL
jgi:hypothetical protein